MADEKDAGLLWRSNDHVIAYKRFMHDLSAHLTTNNIDELKYLVNLPSMFLSKLPNKCIIAFIVNHFMN